MALGGQVGGDVGTGRVAYSEHWKAGGKQLWPAA